MITLLKTWKGKVEINGVEYENIQDATKRFKRNSDKIHIILKSNAQNSSKERIEAVESNSEEIQITVKAYMTKEATPDFDFMAKFNNNIPMPMRVMQGTVEKETRGMYYMHLHGLAKPTITCYCCGKELTNPVSRHYGIGPICLSKLGIIRDIDDVENIREELVNIEWSGWVIKSAITERKEV